MRASVRGYWPSFTQKFEGRLPCMYLDQEFYVTTGVGNLIDPVTLALPLPWTKDGAAATEDEIRDEWNYVKSRTDLAPQGGGAFMAVTTLRLSSSAIDALVVSKTAANEATLRTYFPKWDDFPAEAQLGILSMAWAMGPAFPESFPHFTSAANSGDWTTAADESEMAPTPGIGPRNAADLLLFQNAAKVVAAGGDYDTISYPNVATPSSSGGVWGALKTVAFLGGIGWAAWKLWRAWEGT